VNDQSISSIDSVHLCRTIVYISRPADGLTIDDVHRLVFEARGFNAMNGLHGLLSYDARGFLQVLEGSSDAVDEMFAKLRIDRRHRDMVVNYDAVSEERGFLTFSDFVCEGARRADVTLLPVTARARLSAEVIAAIEEAYAAL
jgi:hypothetical protein